MGACKWTYGKNGRVPRGSGSTSEDKEIKAIDDEIDKLRQENVRLLQGDYTGLKGWGKQLEARSKKTAANNKKIDALERKKKKLQNAKQKKPETKGKTTSPVKWQRAGEGWYLGNNGQEIRRDYKNGGFHIVKTTGRGGDIVSVVKHFKTLKDARNYKG